MSIKTTYIVAYECPDYSASPLGYVYRPKTIKFRTKVKALAHYNSIHRVITQAKADYITIRKLTLDKIVTERLK